jgi:NDP-sugar pyrophosphorylase family protein
MKNQTPNGIVLSAGLGTRLRPLTLEIPKPLVPVCGRPILEWSLDALRFLDVTHVGVNTYYLADQIKTALTHRQETLVWSHETELQGTGGGVRDLLRKLPKNHETLILNGDAFFDFSLNDLLKTHRQRQGAVTLALKKTTSDDPFGRVGVNAQGRVVRIAEIEGPLSHTECELYAFLGAHVLDPTQIVEFPEGECDLFRTAYKTLLHTGVPIYAHAINPHRIWVDVGTPHRYLQAHQALLDAPESPLWTHLPPYEVLLRTEHAPRSQEWIQKPSSLSKNQKIKAVRFQNCSLDPSITLDNVWIGEQSRLTGTGLIESCVFWPQSQQIIDSFLSNKVCTHHVNLSVK